MSQSLAVEADRRGESPLRTIEGKQLIHIASIHIVYDPVCPHTLLLGTLKCVQVGNYRQRNVNVASCVKIRRQLFK